MDDAAGRVESSKTGTEAGKEETAAPGSSFKLIPEQKLMFKLGQEQKKRG